MGEGEAAAPPPNRLASLLPPEYLVCRINNSIVFRNNECTSQILKRAPGVKSSNGYHEIEQYCRLLRDNCIFRFKRLFNICTADLCTPT
jgi:hypothetical protein